MASRVGLTARARISSSMAPPSSVSLKGSCHDEPTVVVPVRPDRPTVTGVLGPACRLGTVPERPMCIAWCRRSLVLRRRRHCVRRTVLFVASAPTIFFFFLFFRLSSPVTLSSAPPTLIGVGTTPGPSPTPRSVASSAMKSKSRSSWGGA